MYRALILVVACLPICWTANLRIDKITNCKARLSGNKLLDLTSLDMASDPMSTADTAYNFFYNPCTGLPCVKNEPSTAAVCKRSMHGNYIFNGGDQNSVVFSYPTDDPNIVLMTYTSDSLTTQIGCFCDRTVDKQLEVVTDEQDKTVVLKLTSKCCCPDGCGTGGGGGDDGKGISFGSVLLIILFSGLFVYFVGGFAYLKYYKHNSGTETIPNYEFWRTTLPDNIKEGFTFTKGKLSSYRRI